MANENKNLEFDYSALYGGARQPEQGAAPQQTPAAPQNAQESAENGYRNVGSSGTNEANVEDICPPREAAPQTPPPAAGAPAANGGGVPPQQPHSAVTPGWQGRPAPKKKGRAGRYIAGALAVVMLAFGGGFAGTYVAGRYFGNKQVVVQKVERPSGSEGSSAGFTQLSVADVYSNVNDSVVAIETEQMVASNTWFGGSQVVSGAGSGVVLTQDGYILTCAHVVNGASHIAVNFTDGTSLSAQIVGQDNEQDIAVLKVEAQGLTPAVIGDSDALVVGEQIIAIGNPLGQLSNTLTSGYISALNRNVTVENTDMTLLQMSAAVSPGNSGGGLFNMAGELVGIVNAKSSDSDAEGLGFAIPSNVAFSIAQELIEKGYTSPADRPVLGVTVIEINDEQTARKYDVSSYGVYIYEVTRGSGAEAAGLQPGDRIVSVDETEILTKEDLLEILEDHSVGDTITVVVARNGRMGSAEVTLGAAQ